MNDRDFSFLARPHTNPKFLRAVLSIAFLGGGIFFANMSIRSFLATLSFESNALEIPGLITALEFQAMPGKLSSREGCSPKFAFIDDRGIKRTTKDGIRVFPCPWKVNETVDIRYLPLNPSQARIKYGWPLCMNLVPGFFGALSIWLGLCLLVACCRKGNERRAVR